MKKRSVSIAEAKARFAECVREAEAGEPVAITRHGRVVAGVVSANDLARIRTQRRGPSKGTLLELRRQTGLTDFVKELDGAVATRGAPRNVKGLE